MSGPDDQQERLQRQVQQWRDLAAEDRDLITLGDANLCARSWNEPDYQEKDLANIALDCYMEENLTQLIKENTRTELRQNRIQKSVIDHIVTNVPQKCSEPKVQAHSGRLGGE